MGGRGTLECLPLFLHQNLLPLPALAHLNPIPPLTLPSTPSLPSEQSYHVCAALSKFATKLCPILQMKKLRLREVKGLEQVYTALVAETQFLIPGLGGFL